VQLFAAPKKQVSVRSTSEEASQEKSREGSWRVSKQTL